ncbi:hypothetical protein HMPREF0742_02351 [Rothia aeria F0184]|uniref:Uncharacterized protein n=1 Tax=Rothia aeria F0184 TaxID=888019 RepID=U7V0I2_9MICC|nr:hypothetical protein HMPREF0742_02351 [Rothia aeria F0184]
MHYYSLYSLIGILCIYDGVLYLYLPQADEKLKHVVPFKTLIHEPTRHPHRLWLYVKFLSMEANKPIP